MTIIQRRLMLLFFFLLFILTAPIIILFAQGYRFDSNGKIFVYSGSITIKSIPSLVDISIDGKEYPQKKLKIINNSYTIGGLRPGKHTIRCEKPGYTSWEKTIKVTSGISTEFWNVILFPLDSSFRKQTTFDSQPVDQFFLSPRNNNELVYLNQTADKVSVKLLDTKKNETIEIFNSTDLILLKPEEKENVEWSSDNKSILIPFRKKTAPEEKEYVVAKIKKDQLENDIYLSTLFAQKNDHLANSAKIKTNNNLKTKVDESSSKIFKVRWMFDKNNELVILTNDKKLYYLNTEKPEEKILLDDNVSAFNFAGNRIYYTQAPNHLVWEIKNNDPETKRQITYQPIETHADFVQLDVYDEYRIAIQTQEGSLTLFNQEKETAEVRYDQLGQNIKGIQFSNDGKKLLYWTENEIWLAILRDWEVQPTKTKGEKIFITRFSQPIKNVQWMETYENIVFNVGKFLKSAEMDNRDRVNIVDIMTFQTTPADREIFYNKNNQTLFFIDSPERKINSALLIEKPGILGF